MRLIDQRARRTRACGAVLVVLVGIVCAETRADVVINELFYASPGDLDLEYIELHNSGASAVDLGGWEFQAGVTFRFPKDAAITAGGFLVIARSAALLKEFYAVDALGEYRGSLSNAGETVSLRNAEGAVVDFVTYDDRAPWPLSADGYSAALERICPAAPADSPHNWAPSELSADDSSRPAGTPGRKNGAYSLALPPVVRSLRVVPEVAAAKELLRVEVSLEVGEQAEGVDLLYAVARPGELGDEQAIAMDLVAGGRYVAEVPGQDANRIVRIRVRATGETGAVRFYPAPGEVRPAVSVYVTEPVDLGAIPVSHVFHIGAKEFREGEQYRSQQRRGRSRGFGFGRGRGEPREPAAKACGIRATVDGRP